ncbi:MAG: orotidine-5'-phosphate decarboxylase [Candidatus Paceibacterota bacterium]
MNVDVNSRIIVALDVSTLDEAKALIETLASHVGCFKVGLQLITSVGTPQVVEFIHKLGGKVFLDGKFNDIPNTIGEAATAASKLGVAMFNVHASSGIEAMIAAVKNKGNSQVLAVTVLTSLEENNINLIFGSPSKAKVLQFARDAKLAGVDGIICSPQEIELLGKQKELEGLSKVVPGVRPSWAAVGDQKRIMTPGDAIAAGATKLVIGRPITKPPTEIGNSVDAVKRIAEEIAAALERIK